jgi:hypothetical protein
VRNGGFVSQKRIWAPLFLAHSGAGVPPLSSRYRVEQASRLYSFAAATPQLVIHEPTILLPPHAVQRNYQLQIHDAGAHCRHLQDDVRDSFRKHLVLAASARPSSSRGRSSNSQRSR